MGIFGALTNAVTGLRAQSYALENISGNIANSQTIGFKRIDTSFQDLIPDAQHQPAARRQRDGTVPRDQHRCRAISRTPRSAPSWRSTATASSWCRSRAALPTTCRCSAAVNLYTRRGDFQTDKNGYLVNGAGYYLMGIPIDASTGNPVGSVPQSLQFNNDSLPAQLTTQIQYRVNLPRVPKTTEYDFAQPGSELLQLADYATNPLVAGGNGGVTANDTSTFLSQSIGGGEITTYDTSGSPVNIQMRWAKTGSATLDGAGYLHRHQRVRGHHADRPGRHSLLSTFPSTAARRLRSSSTKRRCRRSVTATIPSTRWPSSTRSSPMRASPE